MFPRWYAFTPEQLDTPGPHRRAFIRMIADEIFRPNPLLEYLEERHDGLRGIIASYPLPGRTVGKLTPVDGGS
jgi:hypothetical protein